MADACEVGSHLQLRILAALRPFMTSNDHQKEGHKVHLTPVRPICAHLSRTGGNQEALTMGCAGDSVAQHDAQHQLPEQLENKAHAAQWLPEVSGLQPQAT